MRRFKNHRIYLYLFALLAFLPVISVAQINEKVFYTDPAIYPEETRQLRVSLDNLSFFKNNEFTGEFIKGYTLPGFWLKASASYQPLRNLRLDAGVSALCYWGADKYPNYAYMDIAEWKSEKYQPGTRLLPFLRGQIALSDNVDIILGHIYGGANHGLIEPLYYPELNLTADPEVGLQLLYKSRWVNLDAWVNWHSFIFQNDHHQEAFTVGLSMNIKFNHSESRFHIYMPVQGLAQHRGGEIDTITVNSVQTLMNGSVGVGMDWNTGYSIFKKSQPGI